MPSLSFFPVRLWLFFCFSSVFRLVLSACLRVLEPSRTRRVLPRSNEATQPAGDRFTHQSANRTLQTKQSRTDMLHPHSRRLISLFFVTMRAPEGTLANYRYLERIRPFLNRMSACRTRDETTRQTNKRAVIQVATNSCQRQAICPSRHNSPLSNW